MTYEAAEAAMILDFKTKFITSPVMLVAWPNDKFDSDGKTEYVRFQIQRAKDEQVTMGDNSDWRKFGLVVVSIFTELNEGGMRSTEIVDLVTGIYRNLLLSPSITFGEIDVVTIGNSDGYYQENVEIEFHRDEQH